MGEAIQEALAAKEGDDDEEEPDEDRCLQPPNDIPTAKLPLNPIALRTCRTLAGAR